MSMISLVLSRWVCWTPTIRLFVQSWSFSHNHMMWVISVYILAPNWHTVLTRLCTRWVGSHPLCSRIISREFGPKYYERRHVPQVSLQRSQWRCFLDWSSCYTTLLWCLERSAVRRIRYSWNRGIRKYHFRGYSRFWTNHWEIWEADSCKIFPSVGVEVVWLQLSGLYDYTTHLRGKNIQSELDTRQDLRRSSLEMSWLSLGPLNLHESSKYHRRGNEAGNPAWSLRWEGVSAFWTSWL